MHTTHLLKVKDAQCVLMSNTERNQLICLQETPTENLLIIKYIRASTQSFYDAVDVPIYYENIMDHKLKRHRTLQ